MGKQKRESAEDMMRRVVGEMLGERDRKAEIAKKAKDDPLGAMEDMFRRVFNEEYDKRIKAEDESDQGEDKPEGDGGFFARIVGGN